MAKRNFLLIFIINFFVIAVALAEPLDRYPFVNEQQSQQFQTLISGFRCLVCQNQNLADSNADLAKDLRQQVYLMVKSGKNSQEITQYMLDRYGQFILFKPPFNPETYVLWLTPFFLLLIGVTILWRLTRQRNKP